MGIGAGYGGSLKGSDGFNQSAFGRASQTAGQNMNKGLNYSPTLPQHESGDSQGYTRSLLSEGNITIGGKKTSARALGIHTDSATAHHGADSVPDLQNLLDKQQTVAQSTAAIHSAVGTYRGNRAKAAAEELEKQQAAHEGSLKERNDGSYEHYLSLSDAQRQQEMLAHSPAYAQAYQEARSWGVGGSKSRALTAAETLITGALGGQGDLQLAANTLAPYAAAAIGKRFGHGENKNEAAQAIGHFMLGAALAYANGADPLAGGSAAVAAERAAEYLAKQYDDGRTAIDPITGKFNPNLLPEHIKEEIKAQTGALASVVGAAGGSLNGTSGTNTNALFNAQVGGVLAQNAVENNALNRLDGFTPGERSLRARADKIYQNNPKGKDLYIRSYEAYELKAYYLAAKEIVVGTWESIRHPWDNTIVPLAEAVSSPVQTVNKVVMSYENWKAVRDEAYISDPQLAGRMDAMFDARVGANAAFMVVSGGTASAIVRSPAAAKVVKSAGNLSKKGLTLVYINGKLKFGPSSLPSSALKAPVPIVRKAEAPPGKAVPVGEARIPQSPQAVKGTTVTLSQEQRLANGELIPKGSVVTWSDNAVKVVRPDGKKRRFNSRDWEQKALPKPQLPKDYRDDINIGRNNPRFNQQRHEKIESHNPNRIEEIRQRNAVSSAERQADALKRMQTSGRTRLPGQPQKGKPGAAREMSSSDNPNQTAEAFARRYLGRKPTLMERVEGEKLYGGKCVGCWKAQMPDGTFVVYRPAGNASMTKGTTASVDINNPTLNNLNINLKGKPTELKFKFPAR